MEIILLERVAKLGQMGEVVRVRDGYARNFLLPHGKALRATDANRSRFERERSQLEARNLEAKSEAESVLSSLDGKNFVVVRQAGESGQLYGSVSTRDIAEAVSEAGVSITRNQVELNQPIKTIGLHRVAVTLHPEVEATVVVNVARSVDEADRQARGEDMTARDRDDDDIDVESLFEEELPEDVDQEIGAEEESAEGGEEEGGERSS